MHHDDAVGGEMDVELEAVGAGSQTGVKGTECVFRSQRAAASMREDERSRGVKEGHGQDPHEVPES
jgi:hypothetical protein